MQVSKKKISWLVLLNVLLLDYEQNRSKNLINTIKEPFFDLSFE